MNARWPVMAVVLFAMGLLILLSAVFGVPAQISVFIAGLGILSGMSGGFVYHWLSRS
jgi:hypothetical protein